MPSDVESVVRRLYAREDAGSEHRDALEAGLVERFEGLSPRPLQASGLRRMPRWAMVATGLALAVGACMSPSDYAVELGNRVGILVDVETFPSVDVERIVEFVQDEYDLQELRVEVRHERSVHGAQGEEPVEEEVMRIQLEMVGDGIDTDEVWSDLAGAFPALEDARMEDVAMKAEVHGTLGGRLAHDYLDWVLDRHGVDEARQRILEDLAARGYEGRAEVEVSDDAGQRRVKVRVRGEGAMGEEVVEDEDVRVQGRR